MVAEGERGAGGIMRASERRGLTGGVLQFPGVVVVRPGGVADAPMGHRAAGIDLQRFLEAADSLLVMVAKTPVEATVEPALRIRRSGRHFPAVRADIIRIVHVAPCPFLRVDPRTRNIGRWRRLLNREAAACRKIKGAGADLLP